MTDYESKDLEKQSGWQELEISDLELPAEGKIGILLRSSEPRYHLSLVNREMSLKTQISQRRPDNHLWYQNQRQCFQN